MPIPTPSQMSAARSFLARLGGLARMKKYGNKSLSEASAASFSKLSPEEKSRRMSLARRGIKYKTAKSVDPSIQK